MDSKIIDGNSLGYKYQNGVKLCAAGFETQAIFGFVKAMRLLIVENPNDKQVVLWDAHSQWRYDLYPGYKADRDKDPTQEAMRANYKKARPFIQLAFQFLGVKQIAVKGYEADDVAGYLTNALSPTARIELVTGDQDWLMLVKENVSWFDPVRNTKVNHKNFFEFTGYVDGRAFLDGKALQGDTSDKITGVGGIGEKGAPLFLAQFGSVQNFLNCVDDGSYVPKKKAEQRLAYGTSEHSLEEFTNLYEAGATTQWSDISEYANTWQGNGRKIFERNCKLMNLLDVPRPAVEDIEYVPQQFNKDKFRKICEHFNFASILVNFDNFVRPFEEKIL